MMLSTCVHLSVSVCLCVCVCDHRIMCAGKYHSYFTILIHLNSIDDLCGGTEIWSKAVKRGDLVSETDDPWPAGGSLCLHVYLSVACLPAAYWQAAA